MEWLFSWEVVSVCVGLVVTLGQGFIALEDFRLAKPCFLFAAVDAIGGIAMAGTKSTWPFWATNLVVVCAAGAMGFLALQSFRYVDKKREVRGSKLHVTEGPEPPAVSSPGSSNIPAGMTLNPPAGKIELTFKSSPLFNHKVRQRITNDLTHFRDYLVKLEIPVPIEFPPIGTREASTENDATAQQSRMPKSVYTGFLILTTSMVQDRSSVTRAYCRIVLERLIFGESRVVQTTVSTPSTAKPNQPITLTFRNPTGGTSDVPLPPPLDALAVGNMMMTQSGLCVYLDRSFWDVPKERNAFELSFLAGALWDIREKYGREFANQMVRYTLRDLREHPFSGRGNYNAYFLDRMRIGESVVDNGNSWSQIEGVIRKHDSSF